MRTATLALLLATVSVVAQVVRPAPERSEVAPGIHLFRTAPYGAVGLDGNSVAIIGSDGVLVFDSNGTPAAAAAVLAEIRTLTTAPVRYVVHSHWHWDHWYGAEVYREAFPDVTVIAHEKTAAMMRGPALAFNRPGLDEQLPDYIRGLEGRIAKGRATTPPPANLAALETALADARDFLDKKTRVRHVMPTHTFSDRLDVTLGDRQVQILNYGRGVTPGDAFLYLPKERVLITGDLLVNPVSFALSCYPSEWLRVLERLDDLDTQVIVPGHGEPLRDKTLLRATADVFRVLLREGKAARNNGLTADQAITRVMPMLAAPMMTIAGTDTARQDAFRSQLVDWYMHRVFDELAGPLGDDIAPIPAH